MGFFLFAIFIVARKISSDYMFLDCVNETYVRNVFFLPMCRPISKNLLTVINFLVLVMTLTMLIRPYMASNCLVTINIQ